MVNKEKINYLSLFSGIGGFEYGIQQSKHADTLQCIGYSEVDKYATSIYERHYPNHTRLGDATKINTEELQDFDLLVGGFPCQAFSHAGKRRGFNDTRGTLFFEIARILKDKKPQYFLLENVRGLLSHDKGNTFTTILQILAKLGYDVQWQIYNSKNHGVPQNRERLYIKGFLGRGMRCPREILPVGGASTTADARQRKTTEHTLGNVNPRGKGQSSGVFHEDGLIPTLCSTDSKCGKLIIIPDNSVKEKNLGGTRVAQVDSERYCPSTKEGNLFALTTSQRGMKFEKHQDNYVLIKNNTRKGYAEAREGDALQLAQTGQNGPRVMRQKIPTMTNGNTIGVITNQYRIRRLTPVECERLQGFPDNWTQYGVEDEMISDTQRYKCCGNAVTTNVVTYIMDDWNMKINTE